MVEIINYLKARYVSEKAQGIVEYALVLAFVAVVAGALGTNGELTNKVKDAFNSIVGAFASKGSTPNT